jgi:hypothetical protein
MPALNDLRAVAAEVVKQLVAVAAQLLQQQHDALWDMYDPPNQNFQKRFAKAPYSPGADGVREKAALVMLQEAHRAEVDSLLGHNLLARVVNCSMWPRRARRAPVPEEQQAAGGSAEAAAPASAEEEEEAEEEEADEPAAEGLPALYGRGLQRAVEAVLEQHTCAAVDHLVQAELKAPLKALQRAPPASDDAKGALQACYDGVLEHAVPYFKRVVRGPGFLASKLDTDLQQLAKQFRDCVVADIATAKAEILISWRASLSTFGDASAPVSRNAAQESADGKLQRRINDVYLKRVKGAAPPPRMHARAAAARSR